MVKVVGGPRTARDAVGRSAHRDGVARHEGRQQVLQRQLRRWPFARLDKP
jgi:hypothetical protein